MRTKILVIGDGGWGTALAILARGLGHEVGLWSHDPAYARVLEETRSNPKFLPGIELPAGITVSCDFPVLAEGAEIILSVVPTQFVRRVLDRIGPQIPPKAILVSCSKGIELGTLLLPSAILRERMGPRPLAVLSGPSHAEEVARGLPASVVVASEDGDTARRVLEALSGPRFRIYTNPDPLGVETAAAVKNVIALAAGMADGLQLGDNARAALITRGAMEISRLVAALGGRWETFMGLAGIGDLITTCTSRHSRNRSVGQRIGAGETLEIILRSTEKVPEGVETTRALLELSRKAGVDMPITREVHAILFEGKPPTQAVRSLMARSAKEEFGDVG